MATHSSILAWRIPWTEEPIKLNEIIKNRVDRQERNSRNCTQKHTSIRMSSGLEVLKSNGQCGKETGALAADEERFSRS